MKSNRKFLPFLVLMAAVGAEGSAAGGGNAVADKAALKEAEKQAKAAAAAAAKQAKEAAKAAEKQAKIDAKAAADKAKADAKAAKEAEAQAAKEAKAAVQMPEQNGVRRPKPETLCGKAWAIFDSMSAALGSPVSISAALKEAEKQELNPGNVKAEYNRWRTFFGVTGRIVDPAVAEAKAAKEAAKVAEAQAKAEAKAAKVQADAEAKAAKAAAKAQEKANKEAEKAAAKAQKAQEAAAAKAAAEAAKANAA